MNITYRTLAQLINLMSPEKQDQVVTYLDLDRTPSKIGVQLMIDQESQTVLLAETPEAVPSIDNDIQRICEMIGLEYKADVNGVDTETAIYKPRRKFLDFAGQQVEAPLDYADICLEFGEGIVVWSCYKNTGETRKDHHQVRYCLHTSHYEDADRAYKAAVGCIQHWMNNEYKPENHSGNFQQGDGHD